VGKISDLLDLRAFALRVERCPICGPSVLVRLQKSALGVRCLRCRGSANHLSVAAVLAKLLARSPTVSAYELSSRGPICAFWRRHAASFTSSEYFDNVPVGEWSNGVQCQDVQNLTYASESFDICSSTEVFEHVPDDQRGFSEISRVLKTGGHFVFSVPLHDAESTVERARLVDGQVIHMHPPVYHGDRMRGFRGVLCYRDYGRDIVSRLLGSGFSEILVAEPPRESLWGLGCRVLVARKGGQWVSTES
jgi:SAM-dependent methyltransferase